MANDDSIRNPQRAPSMADIHNHVPKDIGLMRCPASHLNGHHPINHDFHETDGVLGRQFVRRKTRENLGRASGLRLHSVV